MNSLLLQRAPFALTITSVIVLSFFLPSCGNYDKRLEEVQSGKTPLNIIVISLDTVRADHLSCYGYEEQTTPNIDKIAKDGTMFTNCRTVIPETLASHTGILSGLLPFNNQVRVNMQAVPEGEYPLLQEILKENGYSTAAFIGSFILDSKFGLDRGFDTYDDDMSDGIFNPLYPRFERRARVVYESATKWLKSTPQEPFFALVHFFDAHIPYIPPQEYKDEFENPYDGEIAYADAEIGKLLGVLKDLKLINNTLIVILGDHGEGLDEHGEMDHGSFIYDQTLRVPLIFYCPGLIPEGRKIDYQVTLVDVMPTILDILGIEIPERCDGRSLVNALIRKKELPSSPCYAESLEANFLYGWSPLYGVINGDWKYIQAPFPELYNLIEDPEELDNLYDVEREKADELAQELLSINSEVTNLTQQLITPPLDPQTLQNLQSLGYITAGGPSSSSGNQPIDPKDRIDILRLFSEYNRAYSLGDQDEAYDCLEKILELDQSISSVYSLLVYKYVQRKELDKAEEYAKKAIDLDPGKCKNFLSLATIYVLKKDYEHGEEVLQNLLTQQIPPWDEATARLYLAGINMSTRKNVTEAVDMLETAYELDKENADILYELANIHLTNDKDKTIAREYISQFHQKFPHDPRGMELDKLASK